MQGAKLIAVVGLVIMAMGAFVHRGGDTLALQSERFGLALELFGLGVVMFARVVQGEVEKKS